MVSRVAIGRRVTTYLGRPTPRYEPLVLNIGRLGSDAAEYYIGEIATSAEDYYSGRGEASGRWIGSLAEKLGLHGAVTSDHFRSVLAGRHPFTHEQLARRRGCAPVHRGDRKSTRLNSSH